MPNITIENVRISYPHLFTPKPVVGGGALKYSSAFLIAKDNPKLQELQAMANALKAEKYPDGVLPYGFKELPLHDGDAKYPGDPNYAGMMIMNASNKSKPQVVDQGMSVVIDPDKVYPGMYVNVAVSVFAYDNQSKGVTVGLEAVQIAKDGDRLDSRPDANTLFQPIPVTGQAPAPAPAFGAPAPAFGAPAPAFDPLA